MIQFLTFGDIFESNADLLVNPVNCVGTMGAGLAKLFKNRYPDNYLAYLKSCKEGELFV
jgi:O-acetyl-ADP-ribose deacetylase (regulator of RNase III)